MHIAFFAYTDGPRHKQRDSPTCMSSLMNLKVLAACEHFSTTWKRTLERSLSSVNSDVVDELVLGLERPSVASTAEPAARVVGLLGTTDVFDCQVDDGFLDAGERATTRACSGGCRFSFDVTR